MAKRLMNPAGLAVLAAISLFAAGAFAQETAPAEQAAAAPAEQATASCADCHDEVVKAFTLNRHAKGSVSKGVVDTSVCETCHDGASEHMETGEVEKVSIPKGRAGADATCVMCHDTSTDRKSHRTGVHANSAAVNCLSCHNVHNTSQEALLRKTEPALCGSCHSTQVASMRSKPFAHRIGEGGMTCTTCHEPHGRGGRESIRKTAAGEIACAGCHSDKRGPFVFEHAGAALGDCASCHEPHGSSNARQLKRASVAQLCLECHSTGLSLASTTAGSQPPAFHNTYNARYQNCTTCHVAVHGSNRSPALLK